MTNSGLPNLPGFSALADTMELVRNMWGGMGASGTGLPGMVMPTLSVDDINKQISDLKAVESWLTLNMNMLRGTIQALEVQSATIATLKSMGQALGSGTDAQSASATSNQLGQTSGSSFLYPFGSTPTAASPTAHSSKPATASTSVFANDEASAAKTASKESSAKHSAAKAPASAASLSNPALWWNMLQDQFKHAVDSAMASESGAAKKSKPGSGASMPANTISNLNTGTNANASKTKQASVPAGKSSATPVAPAGAAKDAKKSSKKVSEKNAIKGSAKNVTKSAPKSLLKTPVR